MVKEYDKKDVTRFLEESNAIEGIYGDDLRQAKEAWNYLMNYKTFITPGAILKTHKILMLNQSLRPDEKGYFRRVGVRVGNEETLDWKMVPNAVFKWTRQIKTTIDVINRKDMRVLKKTNPEELIKIDHIKFEKIHPFVDGNGRVGRLLFLWMYARVGLPIRIIYDKDRLKYYEWFR